MVQSYLTKVDGNVVERPQFMYMRTAIAVHQLDIKSVLETYDALSRRLYTHGSPVLYSAGMGQSRFASCFLFHPATSSPTASTASLRDLSALWESDGGVGLSLADMPARRYVPGGPRDVVLSLIVDL